MSMHAKQQQKQNYNSDETYIYLFQYSFKISQECMLPKTFRQQQRSTRPSQKNKDCIPVSWT